MDPLIDYQNHNHNDDHLSFLNSPQWTLIHAVNINDNSTIQNLIQSRQIQPQCFHNWILRQSIINKNSHIVDFLLNIPDVDPTVYNNLPIFLAVISGDINIVTALINDKRVDPFDSNNRCLKEAARRGFFNIIHLLVNHKNYKGSRCVTEAQSAGSTHILDNILAVKWHPNIHNNIVHAKNILDSNLPSK